METPCSSRLTAASLNSLVNILLDNPMTQFSFEWISSLNWLCQKWGRVHLDPNNLALACALCNNTKAEFWDEATPLINPYSDDPDQEILALGYLITRRPG